MRPRADVSSSIFILLLIGASPASAAIFVWDGGGDGKTFEDPLNWTADSGFPDSNIDDAQIDNAAAQASGTIVMSTTHLVRDVRLAPGVTLSVGSSDISITRDLIVTNLGNGLAKISGTGRVVIALGTAAIQVADTANDRLEVDVLEVNDAGVGNVLTLKNGSRVRVMDQFLYTSASNLLLEANVVFAVPGITIPLGETLTTQGCTLELSGPFRLDGAWSRNAADLFLVTSYANATTSIDLGTNPTILEAVEVQSGATLSPNVDIEIRGGLTVRSGGSLQGGTRTVTFPNSNTVTVEATGTCRFNHVNVNNVTTLAAGSNIAATGTLNVSGTLTANGATANVITIDGGTFGGGGIFNQGVSKVVYGGSTPTMPTTARTFYDLEIAATGSTSAGASYTVQNDWIATTSNFNAGTFTVTFDDSAVAATADYVGTQKTTFNAVVVAGAGTVWTLDTGDQVRVSTLTVNATSRLSLSGSPILEVGTSLTVNGSFTATGQTPILRDTGTDFTCTVAGGAGTTFDVDRLLVENVGDAGIRVNALPAVLFDVDGAVFTNDDGQQTGTYLDVNFALGGARTFSGCSFDNNCQYSVRTGAGSGAGAITMAGAGGARGAEAFENDGNAGVVAGGSIVWPRKTWTNGTGDGLWSTGGNWAPAGAPGANDQALIPDDASHIPAGGPTIPAGAYAIGSLYVEDGGTVTAPAGAVNFTVNGTTHVEPDLGAGSPGSLDLRGTGALVLTGRVTVGGAFVVGNTGAVTLGEDLEVQGGGSATLKNGPTGVTISGSVTNDGTFDLADGGNPDFAATVTVTGNFTNAGSAAFLPGTASTFLFNGSLGAIDSGGDAFRGLAVAGGSTTTATTSLAVDGLLDVNGTLRVLAGLTLTGSFDGTAGTVDFGGAVGQTVIAPPGGASWFNLTISNTSVAGATMGANFSVAGTLLVASGGTFGGGAGFILTLSGTWDNRSTFVPGTSTLSLSGAPTVAGTVVTTFHHVTINAGATLSIGAIARMRVSGTWTNNHATDGFTETGTTIEFAGSPATIAGALATTFDNLTIASGTLGLSGVTSVRLRNVWTNEGTFNAGTSTVVFVAIVAADQGRIAGSNTTTFYAIDLVKVGGMNPTLLLDASDSIVVTTQFTIQANETLRLEGTSTLGLGVGLAIDGAGAKLVADGNKPRLTDTGAYYTFQVRNGGTIDLDGLIVANPDNNGLDIESTAAIGVDLDGVDFTNSDGAATGSYVTIRFVGIPANRYSWSVCTFDNNCQFNVTATDVTSANGAISLTGWSGDKSGEGFDSDPGDPTPSIVEWPEKVWDGSNSTSWGNNNNWTPVNRPGPADRVLVDFSNPLYSGNQPLYDQGRNQIAALYIADGSTLDSQTPNRNLLVSGDATTEADLGAGSRATWIWRAQSTTSSGGLDIGGNLNNDGNLFVQQANPLLFAVRGVFTNRGTFDNRDMGSGFARFDPAAGGGMRIEGDLVNTGIFNPFASQGTTEQLEVRGSWISTGAGTFLTDAQDSGDQVLLSGGTDASPELITSTGGAFLNLYIPAGAVYRATDTLTIGTAGTAGRLKVDGKLILSAGLVFVNAATQFVEGNGTVEFAGSTPQTIPVPPDGAGGSRRYHHLVVSNTSAAGATPAGSITLKGNLSISAGGKLAGSNVTITLDGTGASGDWTNDGTFAAGSSTVVFSGNPSTVRGSGITTFANLTVSTTDSLAVSTATTPVHSLRVSSVWTMNGSFTPGSSTVFFSGGASQIAGVAQTTFNHLTIDAGATLSIGAIQVVNLNGIWSTDGTFTAGTSIVRFTAVGGGIAGANPSVFNVVQVQSAGTLTLDVVDDVTVTGANLPAAPDDVGLLVRAGGTLSLGASATLRLGQGLSIGRSATQGGTFLSAGAAPKIIDTGSRFAFDVFGGTVDIDRLIFTNPNAAGLRINDTTNYAVDADNIDFVGGVSVNGIYLNLRYTTISAGRFNFSGCSFDLNCQYNVHTEPGGGISDAAVTMSGFSGAKGTDDFEDDRAAGESTPPNGDTSGAIRWANYQWTNATGNQLWSDPGNWSPAGPPPVTASVLIPDLSGVFESEGPILNITTTIGSLTMANNSTFATDGGARGFTLTGQFFLQDLGTPADFAFAGSGSLTVGGTVDNDGILRWSSTGAAQFGNTFTNDGTFRIENGANAGNVTISGTATNNGTWDLADGANPDYDGTLRIAGSWTNGATATFLSGTVSTVAFGNIAGSGAGSIRSSGDAFHGVRVESNFTYTATDAIVVNGLLDVNGQLNLEGAVTMAGTFDAAAGLVAYTGTGAQTVVVPPGGSYFDLTIANGGAGVATLGGNVTARHLVIAADGDLAGSTRTFTVTGDFTNDGNLTPGTSTFQPSGTPTTVRGAVATTFQNVVIPAGKTLAVSTTTTPVNHVRVAGNWDNHGTFTAGTSTVTFAGTPSTVDAITATTDVVTRFNHLTIAAGASLDVNDAPGAIGQIEVLGIVTNDSASAGFVPGTHTVRFVGTAGGFAGNAMTIQTLAFAASATITLDGLDDVRVNGSLTVPSAATLRLDGTCTLRLQTGIVVNGTMISVAGTTKTIVDTGAKFGFDVNLTAGGDTLDLDNLNVVNVNGGGIRVLSTSTTAVDIDGVSFTGGDPTAGIYIDLQYAAIGGNTFTFSGCSFDAGCKYNVKTQAGVGANGAVNMTGFSGAKGDEASENDRDSGGPISPGSITWQVITWDNGSGNRLWSNAVNWNPNGVPPANATIIIPNDAGVAGGPRVNLNTTVGSIRIQDGGTITSDNGTRILTVTGSVTIENVATAGAVTMSANDRISIGGDLTANGTFSHSAANLSITGSVTVGPNGSFTSNGAAAVIGGSLTSSGAVNLNTGSIRIEGSFSNSGTFNPTSGTVTLGRTTGTGAGTATMGTGRFFGLAVLSNYTYTVTDNLTIGDGVGAANLNVDGTLRLSGSITFAASSTFDATGGTIEYAGTVNQTVVVPPGGAYRNLTIANGGAAVATAAGSFATCGFQIATGGVYSAGATTMTVGCDFTNDGSFGAGTGRVDFVGNPSTLRGSSLTTFYNASVDFANAVGAAQLAVDPVTAAFQVANVWTSNEASGFASAAVSTVTFTGASSSVAGSQTTEFHHLAIGVGASVAISSTGTTLRLRGTLTNSGNGLVAGGHTVEFTGTDGQVSSNAIEFNILRVPGTLTLTAGDDVRVTNGATGLAVPAGGSLTMTGAATLRLGSGGTAGRMLVNGSFSAAASGGTPTITDQGARFDFDAGGASCILDVDALVFNRCDAGGLTILATAATTIDVDGVSFTNGVGGAGGTKYLNLEYAAIGTGAFSFSGCSFDANCEYNVHTQTGAGVQNAAVNMFGFSGAKGSAAFEDDGGPDASGGASTAPAESTGSIRWNLYTWTNGTASQLWSTPGNWNPIGPPPANATVVIPDTTVIGKPVLNVTTSILALTIQGNGALVTNDSPAGPGPFNTSLTINGTISIAGGATPGTLTMTGTGNLTVSGLVDNDGILTYGASGTFAAAAGIDNSGTCTKSGGTLAVTGDLLNSGALSLSGGTSISGNFTNTGTFGAGTGTVTMSGAGATVSGITGANAFNHLVVPAGANLIATGPVGIGGTLDIDGILDVEDSISMGTSFDASAGTVRYSGSGVQTVVVPPGGAYRHLTIAKPAGTASGAGSTNVEGNLTITSGTYAPGPTTIRVAGDLVNDATFAGAGSTVDFVGANSQVRGSSTTRFNNLAIDLSNAFASSSLAIDTTNPGNTVRIDGTFTNNDTFNGSVPLASTVDLSGLDSEVAGTQVTRFHHLTVTGTAEVTSGTVTTIEVVGTFTHSGAWTPGNDVVRFVSPTGTIAGSAVTFFRLEVTGTLVLDGSDDVTVQGNGTDGAFVAAGATLSVTATSTLRLGATTPTAGVLVVEGSFLASGVNPTLTDAGGGSPNRYAFTIQNGGTAVVSRLNLDRPDANGLRLLATAGTAIDLDGVVFTNGVAATGTYLQLLYAAIPAGTYTFTGCSFDANCQYNAAVAATVVADNAVTFRGYGGTNGLEAFERDRNGGVLSPGSIFWPQTLFTNAAGTGLWNTPGNWDSGAVPGPNDRCVIDPDNFLVATATVTLNISTTISGLVVGEGAAASVTLIGDGGPRVLTVTGTTTIEPDGPDAGAVPAVIDFRSTGTIRLDGLVDNDGRIENGNPALAPLPLLDLRSGLDNSGTTTLSNFRVAGNNVDGTITNTGTITVGDEDLQAGGSWSNTGTFAAGTGRVVLDGTGLQTISGTISFYRLDVAGSDVRAEGTVTVADAFSVAGLLRIQSARTFTLSRSSAGFPPVQSVVSGTIDVETGGAGTPTTIRLGDHHQLVIDGKLRTLPVGTPSFDPVVGGFVQFTRSGAGGGYSILVRGAASTLAISWARFDYLYGSSSASNERTEATIQSGFAISRGASGVNVSICWFQNLVDGGGVGAGNRYNRFVYLLGDIDDNGSVDRPFAGLVLSKLRFESSGAGFAVNNVEKRSPAATEIVRVRNSVGDRVGDVFDLDGDRALLPPGDTGLEDIVFDLSPTAVDLVDLTAEGFDEEVLVEWETGLEVDNLGFDVFRSRFPDRDWVQVNGVLVLGLGNSAGGGRYWFADRTVTNGVRYYYMIEDVDDRGTRTLHGPVWAVPEGGRGRATIDPALYVNGSSTDAAAGTVPLPAPDEAPPGTGGDMPSLVERMLGIDLAAAGIRLLSYDETGAVIEILPPEPTFTEEDWGGPLATRIEMPGYSSLEEPGLPIVPAKTVLLVTPGIDRAEVRVLDVDARSTSAVVPVLGEARSPSYTVVPGPDEGAPAPEARAEEEPARRGSRDIMAQILDARRELAASIARKRDAVLAARKRARAAAGRSRTLPPAEAPAGTTAETALPRGPEVLRAGGETGPPEAPALHPGSLVELSGLLVYGERQLLPIRIHPVQVAGGARVDVYRRILARIDFFRDAEIPPETGVPGERFDTPDQLRLAADPGALKVRVREDGIYRLRREDLVQAGLDVSGDPRTIRMFDLGREIAIRVTGELDGVLGPDDEVLFYGRRNPWRTRDNPETTRYTDDNVYWLTMGGSTFGRRMDQVWVPPSGAAPAADRNVTTHVEENFTLFTRIEDGDGRDAWFGSRRCFNTAGGSHPLRRAVFQVAAPAVSDRPHVAVLEIAVAGVTDYPAFPDHHILVEFGGTAIGEMSWDGRTAFSKSFEIPSTLLAADNQVALTAPCDMPGVAYDHVFVNFLRLSYRGRFEAAGNRIAFTPDAPGEFRATGFAPGPVVGLDVRDPGSPKFLEGLGLEAGVVRFDDSAAGTGGRYVLSGADSVMPPVSIEPNLPSSWHAAHRADWIAIAHPTLLAEVRPLAEHRASHGRVPALVDLRDVYDEFSAGLPDPMAIRAFLAFARAEWTAPAPRFVLLVGDGSCDSHGWTWPDSDRIPVPMVQMEQLYTASDNWYAAVEGADALPDLALGRLPLLTPAEVAAAVAKIVAHELAPPGDWRTRATLVADNDDGAYAFSSATQGFADLLAPTHQVEQLRLGPLSTGEVRARLRDAFAEGRILIGYMGHGSVSGWANENLFHVSDVPGLAASDRLGLVTAMGCMNGTFHFPNFESVGEALLRPAGRGAVAFWGSTSLVEAYPQELAYREFLARFAAGATIGEAVTEAKVSTWANAGGNLDVVQSWVLFGDPASR